jgi:hypothetical protein
MHTVSKHRQFLRDLDTGHAGAGALLCYFREMRVNLTTGTRGGRPRPGFLEKIKIGKKSIYTEY